MVTLAIRYLTESVTASDASDRSRVEWPPHPGRVFMALAAAHFESGADSKERAALDWLEFQPPPALTAGPADERSLVTHYVPVNDASGPAKATLQSAERLTRTRQPRVFPQAWLAQDTAYLVWQSSATQEHAAALATLCGKVSRVGHSTTLVQMWYSSQPPPLPTNWLPCETASDLFLRVIGPGTLCELERRYNAAGVSHFFEPQSAVADDADPGRQRQARRDLKNQHPSALRLRPNLSIYQAYSPPPDVIAAVPGTVFDPQLLILALRRVDGPFRFLDLSATLQLTARTRDALLQHLGPQPPEVLSGHGVNGRSENPHLAILPLPFVGHPNATGAILGLALALPRTILQTERSALNRALTKLRAEGLKMGPLGRWALDSPTPENALQSTRPLSWTGSPKGECQWATVTPYVYDRHSKAKDKAAYQTEIADAIVTSWRRLTGDASQPTPQVVVTGISPHQGVPPAADFPRIQRKDGSECRHAHALLIFENPVVGPVILGAGRFRGYGLFRPVGQPA